MLEVKHLFKEYKSKKGVTTRALDDVSLNFPERGMVFILGKSGSGKSTLLNVCGGLDRMDSGEIIIKGKSSSEFSAQDFDSYRNTFVGFVFQEYNILDEFTVEQNIALALELQNKKVDKESIDKILADVDMTEYATRKPNTLSGGQKQRVAIARALVKEPEIIMADEPTGALDSKTGQQVFDTLKKLSENKLVIVISHDRDFAERYGDRIIELKDGKIISDCTRSPERTENKNVSFYGNDTICVNNGGAITDADLVRIGEFLAKSGGSAVISTSRENIDKFKEGKPEIEIGAFEKIKEQPTPKQYEPQKLIRSHLPVKHAVKMGASSLKTKPVRLMFTILLSVIAFVLFGLTSTLLFFDAHETTVQTFVDSNINYITLGKVYAETYDYGDGDTYTSDVDTLFTENEFREFEQKYNGAIASVSYGFSIDNVAISGNSANFYNNRINGLIEASSGLKVLAGRMPESDDEVAITDYMFDSFKAGGAKFVYGSDNTTLTINSYDDVLYSAQKPVTIRTGDSEFKIVGVFKGMSVPVDYNSIKRAADRNESLNGSDFGLYTWSEERDSGLYSRLAVTPAVFKEAIKQAIEDSRPDDYTYFLQSSTPVYLSVDPNTSGLGDYYSEFAKYEGNYLLDVYGVDGKPLTVLEDGQMAVPHYQLAGYFGDTLDRYYQELGNDSEYQAMLENAYTEARNSYSEPQPNQDDYFDSEGYEAANTSWNSAWNAYLAEHPDADIQDYEIDNPSPLWNDYFDYVGYGAAVDSYEAALNAYVESIVIKVRRDRAVVELDALRKARAEQVFRAKYPEPDKVDSDSYSEWEWQLNYTVERSGIKTTLRDIQNGNRRFDDDEIRLTFSEVAELLDSLDLPFKVYLTGDVTAQKAVDIVGFFIASSSNGRCYMASNLFDELYIDPGYGNYRPSHSYEIPKDASIKSIYVPYDGSRELIEEFVKLSQKREKDGSGVVIQNAVYSQLEYVGEMASDLKMWFGIITAVLAVFAFLLMFNFISASITAKKKEIGILRAIGARTHDVFKIFLSEAMIIALICFALASLGTFGTCVLINSLLANDVGFGISLFVFGPLSILCVLAIAVVTAIVSTVIPVGIYSKKPPIASIRAL